MSGDFKYSALNELLGAFRASFVGGGLPAAKEEFQKKFKEEIEHLSTNHEKDYEKIENLAYGDALANGGFEKKGLLDLCTGDSQIAFRAIDNIWVKVNGTQDVLSKKAPLSWLDVEPKSEFKDLEVLECLEETCKKGATDMADLFNALIAIRTLRCHADELKTAVKELNRPESGLSEFLETFQKEVPKDDIREDWLTTFKRWKQAMDDRYLLEKKFEDQRANSRAPIKEWGKDDWVDMISARYLRENFASQEYAYSLTDSRIFEKFLGATSLPGNAEIKIKENVMRAISQVETATIENGKVVVKAPSLESFRNMFIDAYRFPVWTSCPDPDKWAKVAFFCASQRSVHKKLIETWASEEINGKSVRLFKGVYNAYTRTRSRLINIQPTLKAIQNVLKMLESIVDRLLLLICDLQGNIMAGEACSMQLDFGRLKIALKEIDLFSLVCTRKELIQSVSGFITKLRGKAISGDKCPSRSEYKICNGATLIDVGQSSNLRLEICHDDNLGPYFNSWGDTNFLGSTSSWLAIPNSKAEHFYITLGETETNAFKPLSDNPHMYEACVLWKEKLEFNPQVLCWITKYDFEGGKPIQVGIDKWSPSRQQLKITVRTSAKTRIYQENLKVSYIVYKAAELNKKSNKIFTTTGQAFKGAGPRKLSEPYPGLYFEFPKGMFSEPPAIMLGFHCLSFAAGANPRVKVRADALSKDGVWVSAGPEKDTGMGVVGVSLIAIA